MRHVRAMLTEDWRSAPAEASRTEATRVNTQKRCDTFAQAPCPLCGAPLVARMSRNGPGFPCKCKP